MRLDDLYWNDAISSRRTSGSMVYHIPARLELVKRLLIRIPEEHENGFEVMFARHKGLQAETIAGFHADCGFHAAMSQWLHPWDFAASPLASVSAVYPASLKLPSASFSSTIACRNSSHEHWRHAENWRMQ